MTVKIYKKRTRWYYQYKCTEYQLPCSQIINLFSNFYESNVIYVKFDLKWCITGISLYPDFWNNQLYHPNDHLCKVAEIIKGSEIAKESFVMPCKHILDDNGETCCLNIVDIWTTK